MSSITMKELPITRIRKCGFGLRGLEITYVYSFEFTLTIFPEDERWKLIQYEDGPSILKVNVRDVVVWFDNPPITITGIRINRNQFTNI